MNFKYLFFVCSAVSFMCNNATAQTKPAKPAIVKNVLPKLITSLGAKSDTIVTVSVNEAIALINQPLRVTDNKKGVYTISSYQCLYKKRGVTEDEESGKISPTTSVSAQRFTTTPISAIWLRIITEELKPAEEIFFFDVVVKNAAGKLFFAPNVKLLVK
jgi:hypothetical protein